MVRCFSVLFFALAFSNHCVASTTLTASEAQELVRKCHRQLLMQHIDLESTSCTLKYMHRGSAESMFGFYLQTKWRVTHPDIVAAEIHGTLSLQHDSSVLYFNDTVSQVLGFRADGTTISLTHLMTKETDFWRYPDGRTELNLKGDPASDLFTHTHSTNKPMKDWEKFGSILPLHTWNDFQESADKQIPTILTHELENVAVEPVPSSTAVKISFDVYSSLSAGPRARQSWQIDLTSCTLQRAVITYPPHLNRQMPVMMDASNSYQETQGIVYKSWARVVYPSSQPFHARVFQWEIVGAPEFNEPLSVPEFVAAPLRVEKVY